MSPPRAPTPPPHPVAMPVPPALRFDEDILGSGPVAAGPSVSGPMLRTAAQPFDGDDDAYFREVYGQFMAAKQSCGESVTGVTFEKFSEKLRRNREELMSRTGCRDVTFTVYIKDGKAALKASPVRG
jgi:hypothetical protein